MLYTLPLLCQLDLLVMVIFLVSSHSPQSLCYHCIFKGLGENFILSSDNVKFVSTDTLCSTYWIYGKSISGIC
ncbi:hypothetical protein EUGRSUZ_H00793 [Eucalyptus grandis]|uniref:Uncharacterized protein n=2 Tax=Eucalyptus grandis TaxID=71139 RepID=A0ACC3JMJ3_EUCGR|nr:hypothetical protein EUGRSUZ_H00793 [Eucalyptus grandis]